MILRREAVAEVVGEGASPGDGLAECVIGVLRYGVAVGVEIVGYVADIVIARNIDCAIDGEVKESADASGALQRVRKILAPVVADGRGCAVHIRDALFNEIPTIVEVGRRRLRRGLADAA